MITYRLATQPDNQQLIDLTASLGMAGETALRIDRNPNFFDLLNMRGNTRVFVAEDGNIIVGCICASYQEVFVGEQIKPLWYIGDFKVLKQYRHRGIGLQLCNQVAEYLIAEGADLAFLNLSRGNTKPLPFFKNRPNVPDFSCIGTFNVHQFVGRKTRPKKIHNEIQEIQASGEVIRFLQDHYLRYQLGPVIHPSHLEKSRCFVLQRNGSIVAAMCLWDTMHVKQNVLTSVPFKKRIMLSLINSISSLTGISKMPSINQPVKMIYIKYLAVENNDAEVTKAFINHARAITYNMGYSFASLGLHEKDPVHHCLHGLFKLTFYSVGMLVSIKNNQQLIKQVNDGVPFEDYSLV